MQQQGQSMGMSGACHRAPHWQSTFGRSCTATGAGNLAVGNLAVGNCSIQATQVTVWKIMSPRQHSSVGLISCRVVLHHLPLLMRSYATHLAVESCLFC